VFETTFKGVADSFVGFIPYVVSSSLNVIAAILILIIGIWLSSKAWQLTYAALGHAPHVDPTLQGFFASIIRYLILIFTVLAVLAKFGVQTASLIAVIGAAGLAVGLALQGTLSNVAAGVMLLILRPFRVGHEVEIGGITGIVRELSLFNTELMTLDHVQILIPNSQVWAQPIRNFSFHATRRVDSLFSISYEDDIGKATEAIRRALKTDPRFLETPAPLFSVGLLNQSSVDIKVEVWVKTPDFRIAQMDVNRLVKEAFDAGGLPFPIRRRPAIPGQVSAQRNDRKRNEQIVWRTDPSNSDQTCHRLDCRGAATRLFRDSSSGFVDGFSRYDFPDMANGIWRH
jgi:small conductance mechanosensitive channel